ncbi:hypothetical protein ACFLX5_02040 [Chloroflexota bacterium]
MAFSGVKARGESMSQVFFFDYSRGTNPLAGVRALLESSGFGEAVHRGGSAALKLHMGELGNIRYLRPAFVRGVAELRQ